MFQTLFAIISLGFIKKKTIFIVCKGQTQNNIQADTVERFQTK